jgi:hypothetical protein
MTNLKHRQNQNADKLVIVEQRQKKLLHTDVWEVYLMIPKEIELSAAEAFYAEHPVTPQYDTFYKFLIWLGAYEAVDGVDYVHVLDKTVKK